MAEALRGRRPRGISRRDCRRAAFCFVAGIVVKIDQRLAHLRAPLPLNLPRCFSKYHSVLIHTLALGGDHSCTFVASGSAKCWGSGSAGELGNGSTTNSTIPVGVVGFSAGTKATVISVSTYFSCATLANGTAKCWGSNQDGMLGIGTPAGPDSENQVTATRSGKPTSRKVGTSG